MKYSLSVMFGLFCFVVIFNACHEDIIEEVIIMDEFTPFTVYEIDIIGLISDSDGNPIIDAQLSFAGESKRTNQLGQFSFDNVDVNNQNALLTIEAEGYINAYRRITVLAANTVNVNIVLIPIPDTKTFDAAMGKEIAISDDARVTFFPDGIVRQNQNYNGEVFIKAYHLAKDDADLFQKLPGDLIGIDAEQELQVLETYGMLYVTMEDEQGNELQPDPQTKALLSVDIPEEFVSLAPSEIPLWFFDTDRGVWIEDGVAQRIGNTYEGTVSHFTWWNIDIPYGRLITVCIEAADITSGEALGNQDILFSSEGSPFGIQRTNKDGEICLLLPADLEISLQLLSDCEFNPEAIIGPFDSNQENVMVQLGANEEGAIQINGLVSDCDGQVISDAIGSFTRSRNRSTIDIASDGSYEFTLICPTMGETVSVFIYDANNDKTVNQDFTIEDNQNDISIDIQVCDEVQNLVVGNIFGQNVALVVDDIKINPNETILLLENGCFLSFLGNTTGSYDGAYFCSSQEFVEITVTVDNFGSVISGSFTGDNISGTFSANN